MIFCPKIPLLCGVIMIMVIDQTVTMVFFITVFVCV